MKKLLFLLTAFLFVVSSNAFANDDGADNTGYFSIDAVTIDGAAWNFTDYPEVVIGQTYSVAMAVSYAVADAGFFQDTYGDDLYAEFVMPYLSGDVVWSAYNYDPDSQTTSTAENGDTQVDTAYWALSGDMVVTSLPLLTDLTNGFATGLFSVSTIDDSGQTVDFIEVDTALRFADIDTAPVPEPATMLLLGAGLLGLGILKRKNRKN